MSNEWARGIVKICGVTTVEDALAARLAGVSAIGVILAESPRRVTTAEARDICGAVKGSLLRFAVFRDVSRLDVLATLDELDVDAVQVHIPFDGELMEELLRRGLHAIQGLVIDSPEFYSFQEPRVSAVLIDGPSPGSGIPHSWAPLERRSFNVPVIVAGGLTPDSVAGVIEVTGAWGVDCASGVESSPARKDLSLMSSFVANARRGFAMKE